MANKKRRVVSRKFYNQRTLHKEREYGFYWYSWLWKIIRPVLIFAISAIITVGIFMMFVCNTGVVAPFMGCLMFPAMVYFTAHTRAEFLALTVASGIIFATHLSNFKMAHRKEDVVNTRDFMSKVFGKE